MTVILPRLYVVKVIENRIQHVLTPRALLTAPSKGDKPSLVTISQ